MSKRQITRREFLKSGSALMGGVAASSILKFGSFPTPFLRNNKIANKVVVLGFDGMDPNLIRRFVAEGHLPTFKKLMESGHFGQLQTTMPPQSPVAWASFITGTNPGGHGIYDFVHRDPKEFQPYMSTSRSYDAESKLNLGKWSIPLGAGKVDLERKGTAFWDVLEKNDIPTTIFQIPSNFPITTTSVKAVSGMGTPDLLGTYGTFTFYTDTFIKDADKINGGRVVRIKSNNNIFNTSLEGPKNSFKNDGSSATIDFKIYRDKIEKIVKLDMQGQQVMLTEGEWSNWIPLTFDLIPGVSSVKGMVRVYAKEIHPRIKLYFSPINVDPIEPSLPICSPADFSKEIAENIGRFYTQGFPADSKSLSSGLLSNGEYFEQAKIVLEENFKAFEYMLNRFNEGMFFFYFSNIDQNSHMMLRLMDPTHPLYEPNENPEVKNALRYFYIKFDEALKMALSKVDSQTTLIALSDHGFAHFTREFNLSTWLVEKGYTVLTEKNPKDEGDFYNYVDWSKTKAYALGINGLYINKKGREKQGWVSDAEAEAIKLDIIRDLTPVTDPANGKSIVTAVYDSQKLYSGAFLHLAPDLLVGYQSGYRISDEAVLGKFPKEIVRNRTDKWSADHCSDPIVVPGMLLMNRECKSQNPGLWDMGPTILKNFGFDAPSTMTGKVII